MLGRNCYHQTSATLISDKMDLILKFLVQESMVDCSRASREESFHISFTLHIYYNIFFVKNQKRFFNQLRLFFKLH